MYTRRLYNAVIYGSSGVAEKKFMRPKSKYERDIMAAGVKRLIEDVQAHVK